MGGGGDRQDTDIFALGGNYEFALGGNYSARLFAPGFFHCVATGSAIARSVRPAAQPALELDARLSGNTAPRAVAGAQCRTNRQNQLLWLVSFAYIVGFPG